MSKKTSKKVQEKLESIQIGPIIIDKSGSIVVKINAKPGAKNNNITGTSNDFIFIFRLTFFFLS